jgi:hypothetical protein
MIKIIKERTPVTVKEYYIEFNYKDDPEAGFCFPATIHGDPDFASMPPEAIANYEACLTDDRLTEAEFEVREWTYVQPAVGECSCGQEVVLESGYEGATQCECGRWYSIFGQSLKDPKYWEEDYEY